jgi:hypothetical protein
MYKKFKNSICQKLIATLLITIAVVQNASLVLGGTINSEATIDSTWVLDVLAFQEEALSEIKGYWAYNDIEIYYALTQVTYETLEMFPRLESHQAIPQHFLQNLSYEEFNNTLIELEQVDLLANLISMYYQENGYFPTEEQFMEWLPDIEGRTVFALTPFAVVGILVLIFGTAIAVTQFDVASSMARIGNMLNDWTIAAWEWLSLVVGSAIVHAGSVINNVQRALTMRTAIANDISATLRVNTWSRNVAENGVLLLSSMVSAMQSGHRHFVAYRTNRAGGGIQIWIHISRGVAIARLVSENDTFSVSRFDAHDIATQAVWDLNFIFNPGHGYHIRMDMPHNTQNQPLNLPHYNIVGPSRLRPGRSFDAHAFFP